MVSFEINKHPEKTSVCITMCFIIKKKVQRGGNENLSTEVVNNSKEQKVRIKRQD